jgi:hypothetical protein
MAAFFSSREEWLPLFRSLAGSALPRDAEGFLGGPWSGGGGGEFEFHEESGPWRRRGAVPDDEEDRKVLSGFLDSVHQSLLDIPVDEETQEDDNDLQFLEEGRRMLAINRFHVLRGNVGGSVESVDALFSMCWSELMEMRNQDREHTGSLILLPDCELSDLRRFADMNLLRPLEWLGIHADFEIVSMQRGSPAIRVLYKLQDMPKGGYTEEEGFAAGEAD